MVESFRVNYMSESTEDLIKRAELMLGDPNIYPRIDDILPYSRSGFGFMDQRYSYSPIMTLAPSCKRVQVKNVVSTIDSGIIICTGLATTTCVAGIPANCPTGGVSPNDYVNMVAQVWAQAPQVGLKVVFDYLLNDVPTTTPPRSFDITTGGIGGAVYVYAFNDNQKYIESETLTLHGIRQVPSV